MPLSTVYGDIHRFTLKLFLSCPAMTLPKFINDLNDFCVRHEMQEVIYGSYLSLQGFDRIVFEINEELVKLGCYVRIKKYKMKEENNQIYWVLVNSVDDSLTTLATKLTTNQTVLFKNILEVFVKEEQEQTEEGALYLPFAKIKNVAKQNKINLNHNELLDIVNSFVKDKWLLENTVVKGRYTLGVRSLVELQPVIDDLKD